jgi:hypothetical protein
VEAEHHTLPLAALSAALAGRRIPTRMLGAATPTLSLVRAVRDTVPGAVVVWAQRPDTAGPEVVRALRPYSVRLYIAGPGWPVPPPPGVRPLRSLREAVDTLAGPPAGTAPPAGHAPSGIASVLPAGTLPPSGPVRSL